MSDFESFKIGDLVNVTDYVANGSFAALKENVYVSDEPDFAVLVRLVDFNRGWTPPFSYVTEASYQFLKKSSLETGEVVISNVGANAGTVFKVPDLGVPCTLGPNSVVCKIADDGLLDRDYFFYFLKSPFGQRLLSGITGGSAQPKFNKTDLRNIEITFPDKRSQRAIAQILGTLDDKIECNQKMNQTLEDIAKTIFKSWFVDFDPVRAKAEGRPTGLPPEISDLFPDELVYSEIGEIPKGWEVMSLPDVFDFLEGPGIRNWQYTNDDTGLKFINIRCIINGDLQLETASRITKEEAQGKYAHFALAERDIVVSTSGTLGRYAFVRKKHLPLNLNTSVIRFRPVEGISTLHFLSGFVQNQLQFELEIRASGSVQRNFGPMHLRQISLMVPALNVLEKHFALVDPLFRKRQINLEEIDCLSDLRDTLLPKLISGELRIPVAEKFLAEAGI